MAQDTTNTSDQSHTQALNDAGMYVFMGEVDNETIKPVVEWILHENYVSKKKRKELLLMICSDGGDMSSAFALIDVMRSSVIPIKTVGLGCIASAGLLIFLAGANGRRVLTPYTSILSHQFSWGADGKAHELFATMKEFTLTQARMIEHYKSTTKLSEEEIKTVLLPPHDVWLSAQEALALNICDSISEMQRRCLEPGLLGH
jgi:ATP-dependent Clp protease protease subunit